MPFAESDVITRKAQSEIPLRSGELAVVAIATSPCWYTGAAAIIAPDVT